MADPFLHLPIEDRGEALGVAADRSGRPAHLLEKDVWVVWALATLYGSALGEHLVFKGGTSLSKAYQVTAGRTVGDFACSLHPDGVMVDTENGLTAAAGRTADLLASGWHLAEVKNRAAAKAYHIGNITNQSLVPGLSRMAFASRDRML